MMGSVWAKMFQSYGLSLWIIQKIFSNSNRNNENIRDFIL